MANFKLFEPILFNQEGLYANDPADSGGETWRGISRNNYPAWAGWAIVDKIKASWPTDPQNQAQVRQLNAELLIQPDLAALVDKFYKCDEWDTILGDQIENQSVANFLADWEVNAGETAAVQHAQRLLRVNPDGKMGADTLGALNKMVSIMGAGFFSDLQQARIDFYMDIVKAHPAKQKFLNTWVRRTNSFKFAA